MAIELIQPEIAEKGGRIVKALMEGGAAGWSTLVGKNVTYAIGESDFGRPAEVMKPAEIGDAVVTPVDWSGDNTGKVHLIVPAAGAKEVVAYMMALMLGGAADPAATNLDTEGMDAYSEAVNSFFGQGAQQARGEIGGVIKTAVGTSRLVDFAKSDPASAVGTDEALIVKVMVTLEGRPPFGVVLLVDRGATGVKESPANVKAMQAEATAEKLGIDPANLGIAMRIRLPLVVTIAAKRMRMELIQDMCPGTIIEFKKMSGEPLDVLAGNVKVATAEAVIINQCFGVQVRSIVDPRRLRKE